MPAAAHEGSAPRADDQHVVQFYEGEPYLYEVVAQWMRTGIEQGRAVVVVATEAHRRGFAERLAALGHDARALVASGRLIMLDAHETLQMLMVASHPDPERFEAVIGAVLQRAAEAAGGGPVRTYGEMVDVLLRAGNRAAALRLEEIWNDHAQRASFQLLCAYEMSSFRGSAQASVFDDVCARHTHVLPTEEFQRIDGHALRLREIATLQQRAQSLEEAVRVRDEFMSVAGHELRTPLTALRLQVHAIAETAKTQTDPKLLERTTKASRQIDRLAKLIDQLLDVTRIESGQLALHRERMDLGLVVREVCDRHADGAAHAQCALRVLCEEPLVGEWDRLRVEQVVLNLVSNAIKYGAGKPVEVLVRNAGEHATLIVRDHGIGIAPEDCERIFERFERAVAGRRYGGLGLGLWIARQAIEAHGGNIRVETRQGQGSTFTVQLPFAAP